MTDLDALKALEQAATPAPWTADTNTRGDCVLWGPNGQFVANAQAEPHWLPAADGGKRAVMFDVDRRDVELIAAVRNHLPALLDELAAVTADRDGYRQMFGKLVAYVLDAYHQTENDSTELAWELTDLLANGEPLDEWVREQLTARGVNVDEITAS